MAKVYDYNGISAFPALLEDPRVTSNDIYFFGQLHDKDSLSPVFNAKLNTGQPGASYNNFSNLNNQLDQTINWGNQRLDLLFLKKPTVHVAPQQPPNNQNSTNNGVQDNNSWWTLDRSYEYGGNNSLITDAGFTCLFLHYGLQTTTNVNNRIMYGPLSSSQKLSDVPIAVNSVWNNQTVGTAGRNKKLIGVHSTSKLVFGQGHYTDSNSYHGPHAQFLAVGPTFPSTTSTIYTSITNIPSGTEIQFLGLSLLDGQPLWFCVNRLVLTAATTVQKVVWASTTPTITQMYTISSAISAGGTSSGGNRMAGNYYPASASSHFTDPRVIAGTTKCWYWPYFDSNRNFHPILYTWNQTNDTFSRETDITITGDLSSVHADMSSLYSTWTTSSSVYVCANMICHTFVNDSNRYVMFINVDAREQYPTTPGPRTSVVYAVNASNPKALTYHSKITWPNTPKNVVFLNDAQTLMGMFFQNIFKVYAWNNSTGWQETVAISKQIVACGRDGDGRIWYVQSSDSQANTAPELHILTPSLPVSITINPEFASYDYAGTPINSYINVSAYNASGARIAADVKLVINGGSMTFSDSTTVKTITTLTNAEKQQNIIITGAGFSNITASVEI